MFFRRETPKNPTFADRLECLRKAGFTVAPEAGGVVRVSRGNYAVDLKERDSSVQVLGHAGIRMGDEIGALVDGGYQKFFRTPSGKKKPGPSRRWRWNAPSESNRYRTGQLSSSTGEMEPQRITLLLRIPASAASADGRNLAWL